MRAVLTFIAPETCGASIKDLEDNQGAKALIENPLSSARSKHHIDVRLLRMGPNDPGRGQVGMITEHPVARHVTTGGLVGQTVK